MTSSPKQQADINVGLKPIEIGQVNRVIVSYHPTKRGEKCQNQFFDVKLSVVDRWRATFKRAHAAPSLLSVIGG